MHPEEIARFQAQHDADLRRWWRRMPGTEAQYRRCRHIMSGHHGSLHWDGRQTVDASWTTHQAQHAFGVRDPLAWLALVAQLQANGLAEVCSLAGTGPEHENAPLESWGELTIRMAGVVWLAERLAAQPEQALAWYCDDCRCLELDCNRHPVEPLGAWCWEHRPEWEGERR